MNSYYRNYMMVLEEHLVEAKAEAAHLQKENATLRQLVEEYSGLTADELLERMKG